MEEKMDWKFVLALIFALLVAIFALQNAGAVDISFLTFELSVSQALVILISAIIGALVVMLLSLIRWIKLQSKIKSLTKQNSILENEVKKLTQKVSDLEAKGNQGMMDQVQPERQNPIE